jgi:probable F420-dependent oxidoreductase
VRLGLVYPQTELAGDPEAVRRIGTAAEELDYDYVLAYDHVVGASHDDRDPPLRGPYTQEDPFHDPFVMFAYLAGMTERIELATGVVILPQRQTVLVAKQAADLDLLSGGRFRLGVGVGWNWVEYAALGQDFHTRGARLDEQIGFLRRLWTEDVFQWEGRFDRIDRGTLIPKPQRSIPIWVGGFSDAAFRRGATLGDGFQFVGDIERATGHLEQVEHFAAQSSRDLSGFGRELLALRPRSIDDVAQRCGRWKELGGTHFAVVSMGLGFQSIADHVEFFAEVRSRL